MKPRLPDKPNKAMTLTEVVVVIATLALVAVVLLQALTVRNPRPSLINCVNNMKQIGLAYREWAEDYGGKYPMEVSGANGGAMELVATGNVASVFQVMSNELSTTRILVCPEDKERYNAHYTATSFSVLSGSKDVSYFVGLDASSKHANAFLCGDHNFEIGGAPVKPGLLEISTNTSFGWTSARHIMERRYFWNLTKGYGNIGFPDGSVQRATDSQLRNYLIQTGLVTNHLAIP